MLGGYEMKNRTRKHVNFGSGIGFYVLFGNLGYVMCMQDL